MSSFNADLNSSSQFIIAIKVVKSSKEEEYLNGIAQELIVKASSKRALIDAGASNTCISQECADELNLTPIGKTIITTASDDCDVNRYIIDFAIPVAAATLKPIKTDDGRSGFEQVIVDEEHWAHAQQSIHSIPATGRDRGFDLILGMDVLSKMHITMFNRQIIMSF